MPVLQLQNITKKFVSVVAVDDVSFSISDRSIFGLLGPNGAGKTTIIRMITQILIPDSGVILLQNEQLKPHHTMDIGYMPEERGLYKKMKVGDQLLYLAAIRGMPRPLARQRIKSWMEKFGLSNWINKKVTELSKGMQQKVQFISTVIHEPKLLILDEPFSGLDPLNTNIIKEEIRLLRDNGATVIFSTHRMEQVEEICDDILLINNGKKILEGNVNVIKQNFKENDYSVGFEGEFPKETVPLFEIKDISHNHGLIHSHHNVKSTEILRYLVEKGLEIHSFNEVLPSLNDIFIRKIQGETVK